MKRLVLLFSLVLAMPALAMDTDKEVEQIALASQSTVELLARAQDGDAEACLDLGYFYFDKSNYHGAMSWFAQAQNNAGENPELYIEALMAQGATAGDQLGDDNVAIHYFTQAAKNNSVVSQYNLGKIYLKRKDYKNAELWFTQALDNGYTDAQAKLNLVHRRQLLQQARDVYSSPKLQCASPFKRILTPDRLTPYSRNDSPSTQSTITLFEDLSAINIGRLHYGKGNMQKAKDFFAQAVKEQDDEAPVLLATILLNEGKDKEAQKLFQGPQDAQKCAEVQFRIGLAYANQGDDNKAKEWWKAAKKQGHHGAKDLLLTYTPEPAEHEQPEQFYQLATDMGCKEILQKRAIKGCALAQTALDNLIAQEQQQ